MTCAIRVWLRAALWGLACCVAATASADTTLGTFQNWAAVSWTTADKTTACSADNTVRSKPGSAPDLYVAWFNTSNPYGFLTFQPRDTPLDATDRVATTIDGANFNL